MQAQIAFHCSTYVSFNLFILRFCWCIFFVLHLLLYCLGGLTVWWSVLQMQTANNFPQQREINLTCFIVFLFFFLHFFHLIYRFNILFSFSSCCFASRMPLFQKLTIYTIKINKIQGILFPYYHLWWKNNENHEESVWSFVCLYWLFIYVNRMGFESYVFGI